MPPTVVAFATGVGSTSAAVTTPAVLANDVLLAVASTHGAAALTQPAGFVVREDGFTVGAAPVIPGYSAMSWRRVTPAEPATHTWTGGTSSTAVGYVVLRGCRTTGDPFHASRRQVNSVAPTGPHCGSIITTVADTLIIAATGTIDNRGYSNWAMTDPAALTTQVEALNTTGNDSGASIAVAPKAAIGGTGGLSFSSVFSSHLAYVAALAAEGAGAGSVTKLVSTSWGVSATVTKMVSTTWSVLEQVPVGSVAIIRSRQGSGWRVLSGGVPTIQAPTAPRTLAVVAASGELRVSWMAPYDDGGADLTGYTLTLTPDDVAPLNLPASSLSATLTGLANGTPYTVRVVARNAASSSPAAEAVASPAGSWVLGATGSQVGAPAGWGGNGGTNNGRGYYAATAPPPGVTNGYLMGPSYCGVLPVLTARGMGYSNLSRLTLSGTWVDAKGLPSGVVSVDPVTGSVSLTIDRPGAIAEYLDIVGQIFIDAPNVTIRFCRVDGNLVTGSGKYLIRTRDEDPGLVIAYSELICGQAMSAALPPYGGYTARYLEVRDVSNDAFKVGSNALVEFCWVHQLRKAPGAHADAVQWTAGDNIAVRFNRLELFDGPENGASPELTEMGNGVIQVGKMTGNGSWFAMDDNFGDGSNLIWRVGNESPQVTAKGTFTTTHAYWRRNRTGLRWIGGPVANNIQPDANQVFDDSNVFHEGGQTYHRQGTSPGVWYYSHVVVADTPVNAWTPTHFGTYP